MIDVPAFQKKTSSSKGRTTFSEAGIGRRVSAPSGRRAAPAMRDGAGHVHPKSRLLPPHWRLCAFFRAAVSCPFFSH
jgi:hypothetical protein